MKKWFLLTLLVSTAVLAQDDKEASSDQASVIEGLLRDARPTFETTLADGTRLCIWALSSKDANGQTVRQFARATAKNDIRLANEGMKSITSEFNFTSGKVANVLYSETVIVQNPTPSVTCRKKELIFTDGKQTSPAIGSATDVETFVNLVLPEIEKLAAVSK